MNENFWRRLLSCLRHAEIIFGSTILMPDFDCEATQGLENPMDEEGAIGAPTGQTHNAADCQAGR